MPQISKNNSSVLLSVTIAFLSMLSGRAAVAEDLLSCSVDASETSIGCDVVADNVRVEYYNVNRGKCGGTPIPDSSVLKDRGVFFELGSDGRSVILSKLGQIGGSMPDSEKYVGFDYSLPIMSMKIPEAASALRDVYAYFLANGYTFGDYLGTPLEGFTLDDLNAIAQYLDDQVLGDHSFGDHFSIYSSCKVLEFGVIVNGGAQKWTNY